MAYQSTYTTDVVINVRAKVNALWERDNKMAERKLHFHDNETTNQIKSWGGTDGQRANEMADKIEVRPLALGAT